MEEQVSVDDASVDKNASDVNTEERARRWGWSPKEEFRGHPDRWVDAETYIERAAEHIPLLKGTVSTMEKKMEAQERLIADQNKRLQNMQSDIKEFVSYTRLAEERAFQKALKQLKDDQRQAVEEQDLSKFDLISAEIDEHIQSRSAVVASGSEKNGTGESGVEAATSVPPAGWAQPGVYEQWLDDNVWYREKPKMAAYAHSMDRWLSDTKPQQTQKERLTEISQLVKEEFPEYWSNTRRMTAPSVEGGGDGAVGPKSKRTYSNLPPEAKAACDRFCGKDGKGGTIPGYTRDDYLKDYDWGE